MGGSTTKQVLFASNIHKITNSNFPTLNNAKPQKPIAARHEMSIRG